MGEIRTFPTNAARAQREQGHVITNADLPGMVVGPQMLYAVKRIALAQGMLMARFGMREGSSMEYLADQAERHEITLVELAERVIARVTGS